MTESTEDGLRAALAALETTHTEEFPARLQVYAEYLDDRGDPRGAKLARVLELIARGRLDFACGAGRQTSGVARGYLATFSHAARYGVRPVLNAAARAFGWRFAPDRCYLPDVTCITPPDSVGGEGDWLTTLQLIDALCAVEHTVLEDACRE